MVVWLQQHLQNNREFKIPGATLIWTQRNGGAGLTWHLEVKLNPQPESLALSDYRLAILARDAGLPVPENFLVAPEAPRRNPAESLVATFKGFEWTDNTHIALTFTLANPTDEVISYAGFRAQAIDGEGKNLGNRGVKMPGQIAAKTEKELEMSVQFDENHPGKLQSVQISMN